MSPWTVLIIIIFIIVVVWWALLRNARTYKADFPVHHAEGHSEHGEAGQSPEVAALGTDGHSHVEAHAAAPSLPHEAASGANRVRGEVPVDLGEEGGEKDAMIEKGTADLAGPALVTETPLEKLEPNRDISDANAPLEPSAEIRPDNLIIIEGIGPKVNQVLRSSGIHTFARLAETDVEHLRAILASAGLRYMDPSTWPQQARLASEGKLDELKALQDSLRGGRSA